MKILVVDIGGTNVKLWRSGETDKVKFPSGPGLTPAKLIAGMQQHVDGWAYDRASIGYPGDVRNGHPTAEPFNLGLGWVDFDYGRALGCPVRIMNDACMQALGSYEGGRMLYLGLGTSIGTTLIFDGKIIPLALGHLCFCNGDRLDDRIGRKGLKRHGPRKWQRAVTEAAEILQAAFLADYVTLGGGNAKRLTSLPENCRRGGNHNAYFGGLRMWEDANTEAAPASEVPAASKGESSAEQT